MYHFDFEPFIAEKREEYIKMVKEIFDDMEEKKTYEQGLTNAWEAAREIALCEQDGGLSVEAVKKIFGVPCFEIILKNFDALEAIAKIKAYEEDPGKIKVGDEVIENDDISKRGVVTNIKLTGSGNVYNVLWDDGRSCGYYEKEIKKTGRHFSQIKELLKAMKERSENNNEILNESE